MYNTKKECSEKLDKVLSRIKELDDLITTSTYEVWGLRHERDILEGKLRAFNLYYEGNSLYILQGNTKIPYIIIDNIFYISIRYTCLAAGIGYEESDFYKYLEDIPLFKDKFKEIGTIETEYVGWHLEYECMLAGLLTYPNKNLTLYPNLKKEATNRIMETYNTIKNYVQSNITKNS